ncbi:MAG: Gfo/Idh/MocA family protein [Candidatus Poribacteria bacterium]
MAEQVKIGFIGCGGNAIGHMSTLSKMEDVKLVALCDVKPELAKSATEQFGGEPYTNHKEMLERKDLDAVYISIPVFAHGEPELDTINRGLPFFVEKPVAISMEIAEKVLDAVEKNKIITCVGYQLRYAGSVDATKEVLKGKIITMVNGKYWCNSGVGGPSFWLRQMSKSGGQLVEQATHTVDMMRCLAGEITEVFAYQENRVLKDIDCPDVNVVVMKFENGALGSLTTTWAYEGDWDNANVLDILFNNSLLKWSYGDFSVKPAPGKLPEKGPSQSIDRVFIDAVKSGDGSKIRSPYRDAIKTLSATLAMNKSAKSGKPEAC